MKKIDRMIEIMDGIGDQLRKQEAGLPLDWRCPVCGLAPSECSCVGMSEERRQELIFKGFTVGDVDDFLGPPPEA